MKNSYIKYIVSLLIFGSNGIIASFILLNSKEIVLTRTLLGSLFLIATFFITRQKLQFYKHKKSILYLVLSGISMGASWMFLFEAYNQIGVSVATLVYYSGPVIVMLLSPLIFKERFTITKIIGFIIVVIGMVLVNNDGIKTGKISFGLICGILSALLYAFMVIFNKKAVKITGLENSMCQVFVAFITVTVSVMALKPYVITIPTNSIIPVLILGAVNTGLGCYLYFSSIQKLPAQSVSICGYIDPLSALVFSALFLNERMTILQIIGAVFILGGAAFGELFKAK